MSALSLFMILWIFPAMLLKTAMTVPLIFSDESLEEQKNKKKKINCRITVFMLVAIVYATVSAYGRS